MRQKVPFGVGLESAMISLAAAGNSSRSVMGLVKATNYTGAVVGMADNYLNAYGAIRQGNIERAQFEILQGHLYLMGAGMLRSKVYSPIGGVVIFGMGIIDLGQNY